MSILKRIKSYFESSIHEAIDKAENPEAKVNQIIRDLEEGLIELRKHTGNAMAALYVAEENLQEIQSEAKVWYENACVAMKEGREDLARKSLEKKAFYDARVDKAIKQVTEDRTSVQQLKIDLEKAEETIEKARFRRETIIAQRKSAEARAMILDKSEKLLENVYQIRSNSDDTVFNSSEMALRRLDAENKAKAELLGRDHANLNYEVKELKMKATVDKELALLKAQIAAESEK